MKKTVIFLLILSVAFGIFSGCGNNTETKTTVSDTETTSSVVTESTEKKPQNQVITTGTTVYSDKNYTYHSIVYQTEKKTDKNNEEYTYAMIQTTEYVPITIITTPKTTKIETTKPQVTETTQKTSVNQSTTRKTGSTEPVKEIANGLSVLTKTTPVIAGNSATITIMGNPNKNYSIEYYEEGSTPSVTTGLETKKSDDSGFVSWTFSVSPLCSAGPKKIVIKENGSNNCIQTSITVM